MIMIIIIIIIITIIIPWHTIGVAPPFISMYEIQRRPKALTVTLMLYIFSAQARSNFLPLFLVSFIFTLLHCDGNNPLDFTCSALLIGLVFWTGLDGLYIYTYIYISKS